MGARKDKKTVLEPSEFYNLSINDFETQAEQRQRFDFLNLLEFPLVPEDTQEEKIEGIAGRSFGGYRIKTIITGKTARAIIFPWYGRRQDVPDKKRRERSAEEIVEANERRSIQHGQDLINTNFTDGDIWFSPTWNNEKLPQNDAEQQRYVKNYIERLRRRHYKNGGTAKDFKWLATLEVDAAEGIRANVHFAISGKISFDDCEELWRGGGRNKIRPVVTDKDGVTGMAVYITKPEGKRKRRWVSSLNLKRPVVKTADNKTTKSQVKAVATNVFDLQAYFEKLYPGWEVTQEPQARFNEKNDGVFLYARLCVKAVLKKDEKVLYGKEVLKNELSVSRARLLQGQKAKRRKAAKPDAGKRPKR